MPLIARLTTVLCTLLFVLLPASGQATVLADYTLDELIAQSSLIVEGQVLSHSQSVDAQLLYTTVVLRIDSVLKGDASETELPLRFVGGSDGTTQLEVSGQFIPAAGQRGIFFINDPYTDMVNPLTGWYQGFFRELLIPGDTTVYLDLQARPDLILINLPTSPMLKKLLGLGLGEAEISARFPDYQRFPAEDFKAYIRYQTSLEGR